jgi:hypothetical protein
MTRQKKRYILGMVIIDGRQTIVNMRLKLFYGFCFHFDTDTLKDIEWARTVFYRPAIIIYSRSFNSQNAFYEEDHPRRTFFPEKLPQA